MNEDWQRIDWLATAAGELASQDIPLAIRATHDGFEVSIGRVAVEASTLRQALDVAIEATTRKISWEKD